MALFKKAARSAVRNQVLDFREKYYKKNKDAEGRVMCQESGELVSRDNCDVDHHPKSFDSIVEDFIAQHSIDVSTVKYTGFDDNSEMKEFSDLGMKQLFSDFHLKLAHLRITTRAVNLSKKRS